MAKCRQIMAAIIAKFNDFKISIPRTWLLDLHELYVRGHEMRVKIFKLRVKIFVTS